jgi:hypothetical protein
MDRAKFIRLLQTEITRRSFDTFVDNPPSDAKGGLGIVVPGCATCNVRAETTNRFLQHRRRASGMVRRYGSASWR